MHIGLGGQRRAKSPDHRRQFVVVAGVGVKVLASVASNMVREIGGLLRQNHRFRFQYSEFVARQNVCHSVVLSGRQTPNPAVNQTAAISAAAIVSRRGAAAGYLRR
mgnify:CR=1 FL=1